MKIAKFKSLLITGLLLASAVVATNANSIGKFLMGQITPTPVVTEINIAPGVTEVFTVLDTSAPLNVVNATFNPPVSWGNVTVAGPHQIEVSTSPVVAIGTTANINVLDNLGGSTNIPVTIVPAGPTGPATSMDITIDNYGVTSPDTAATSQPFILREEVMNCEGTTACDFFSNTQSFGFYEGTMATNSTQVNVSVISAFFISDVVGAVDVNSDDGGGVVFAPFIGAAHAQETQAVVASGNEVTVFWDTVKLRVNNAGGDITADSGYLELTLAADLSTNSTTHPVYANINQAPYDWKDVTVNGSSVTQVEIFASQMTSAVSAPVLGAATNVTTNSADIPVTYDPTATIINYTVDTSANFDMNPITTSVPVPVTNINVTGLAPETEYFVKAMTDGSPESNVINFTTTSNPCEIMVVIINTTHDNTTFGWDGPADGVYEVQISTSNDFSGALVSNHLVTGPSYDSANYPSEGLTPGQTYYVRVRLVNAPGGIECPPDIWTNDSFELDNSHPSPTEQHFTSSSSAPEGGHNIVDPMVFDPEGDALDDCTPRDEDIDDWTYDEEEEYWRSSIDDDIIPADCGQFGFGADSDNRIDFIAKDEFGAASDTYLDQTIDNSASNVRPDWKATQPAEAFGYDGNFTYCEETNKFPDGTYRLPISLFISDQDGDSIWITDVGVLNVDGTFVGGNVSIDPADSTMVIITPPNVPDGTWVSFYIDVTDGHGHTVRFPFVIKITHNVLNPKAENIMSNSMEATWDAILANGDTVHSYKVQVTESNNPTNTQTVSVSGTELTAEVTGLNPSTDYTLVVYWEGDDKNNDGLLDRSADSEEVLFTTLPAPMVCEANDADYYSVPAVFECNGQTVVDTWNEYQSYISSNYGNLSNLKVRDLTGAPADAVIESPCLVTFAKQTMIGAASLRVDGLKGVSIGSETHVNISNAEGICITSGLGNVHIGKNTELNTSNGDINLKAYLKADINGDSTMTAGGVIRFISYTNNVDIGNNTVVNTTSFASESAIETQLRQNYAINASANITLTGADIIIGTNGTLSAGGTIGVNATNSAHFKQDQNISAANIYVTAIDDDAVITVGKDADLISTGDLSLSAPGLDSELNLKKDSYLSAVSLHGSATICTVNKNAHWNASSVSGNCITTLSK